MRYKIFSSFFFPLALMLFVTACKKSSDSQTSEENLVISTDASSFILSPASSFSFNVKVESAMPAGGVQIVYEVKGEADNMNYPQGPLILTTNKSTAITLTSLPNQKICICTVTVTSRNKSTNKAVTSFRVTYK